MEKKIPKEIKSEREHNKNSTRVVNIILAIVLAVILWAYVLGEVNPETQKTINGVPLYITGESVLDDKGLVILTEIEDTVTAVIEGRRSEIYDMSAEKLTARIDVSLLREGENQVEVRVTAPGNVNNAYARDGNLVLIVDSLAEETEPITVDLKGSLGAGSDVKITSMSDDKVVISGPSTYLAKVKTVGGVLNVNSKQDTFLADVELKPYDEDGQVVEGVDLSIKKIKVEATRYETKTVPVSAELEGTAPEGTKIGFDEKLMLKITGDAADVKEVTELGAEPVNISNIEEDKAVQITVTVPPGVNVLDSVGKIIEKNSSGKIVIEATLRVTSEDPEQKEE